MTFEVHKLWHSLAIQSFAVRTRVYASWSPLTATEVSGEVSGDPSGDGFPDSQVGSAAGQAEVAQAGSKLEEDCSNGSPSPSGAAGSRSGWAGKLL